MYIRQKKLMAVALLAVLLVSVTALPVTCAAEPADAGMGLSWAGMIWSAYNGNLLGVGLSMLGYYVTIGGLIVAAPTGGAGVFVAL